MKKFKSLTSAVLSIIALLGSSTALALQSGKWDASVSCGPRTDVTPARPAWTTKLPQLSINGDHFQINNVFKDNKNEVSEVWQGKLIGTDFAVTGNSKSDNGDAWRYELKGSASAQGGGVNLSGGLFADGKKLRDCTIKMVLKEEEAVQQATSETKPVVSKTYQNKFPFPSGGFVTLPQGDWKNTYTTSISLKNDVYSWDTYVFKNMVEDPSIPFLTVRMSDRSVAWSGNTSCTDAAIKYPYPSSYLVNSYGNRKNELINKCTVGWRLRPFPEWLDYKPTSTDIYWKDAVRGFEGGKKYKKLLMLDFELLVFKNRGLNISLFVTPPGDVDADKFIDGFKVGNESNQTAEHQKLVLWISLYIEAIEQSFARKEFSPMIALNMPKLPIKTAELASTVLPVISELVKKVDAGIVKSAGNPSSPNSNVQVSPLDPQLKLVQDEKRKLEVQLDQMRDMLAQIKKANEQSAQQIQNQFIAKNDPIKPEIYANRKALVIGNDSYKSVGKLENAREDARTMASNLSTVGYQVTLKLDLNDKEMKAALRNFADQVQGGDEVLFFYAGHGVQLGAANYLLPTDIIGDSEAQVKDEAIQLQRFLDDMADRKAKFTLAMIDACRDNPFKSSGRAIGGRGLSPTTAATGQMVIFSAGSGQQALDKLGHNDKNKNGLFTRIFVQEMQKSGLTIDRVVKNVRNQVAAQAKSVGHEQVPAIYDQVLGDFYFKK